MCGNNRICMILKTRIISQFLSGCIRCVSVLRRSRLGWFLVALIFFVLWGFPILFWTRGDLDLPFPSCTLWNLFEYLWDTEVGLSE